MPVRLIARDIDGTLLDGKVSLAPRSIRDAVAEAAARGNRGRLVTGRRYDFATPNCAAIPLAR